MMPLAPKDIAERLSAWRAHRPSPFADCDANTRRLCELGVSRMCDADLLAAKLANELGQASFRPLGRVLIVVSENDLVGTAMALVGACLTGNTIRIKARHTRPLIEELKLALELDDDQCQVLDWSSVGQDDALALQGVDGVLLAGSAELIAHYRRVTPVGARLIEYGPKLSAAAVGSEADVVQVVPALLHDVTSFEQRVCSSPQFVLVDGPAMGQALFAEVCAQLGGQAPLPYDDRLVQHGRAAELCLRNRLEGRGQCYLDDDSGWGATLSSEFATSRWLSKGVQIIAGPLPSLVSEVVQRYRGQLQTLGYAGLAREPLVAAGGFTRVCSLGRMHERSPLEAHDGMLELPQLVQLVS